jgi:hypothetical protein
MLILVIGGCWCGCWCWPFEKKERKVGAGSCNFPFRLRRLVGGQWGLTMVRSDSFFFAMQMVASLTADLDRTVAADYNKGRDLSWWLYFRVVGVGRGDGVAAV